MQYQNFYKLSEKFVIKFLILFYVHKLKFVFNHLRQGFLNGGLRSTSP